MTTSTTTVSADVTSNLSNLLPTGTFLAFQAVAPIFTNNGACGNVEKVMTSVLIALFGIVSFVLNFTDSLTTPTGKVYYGIVTTRGLFSPQFRGADIEGLNGTLYYKDSNGKYDVNIFDFVNGILNVVTFSGVSLLTAPITSCFYPNISSTIIKCVPILIGLTVAIYCAVAPNARTGIGFAMISNEITAANPMPRSRSLPTTDAKEALLPKEENNDFSIVDMKQTGQGHSAFEPSATPPFTSPSSPLHRDGHQRTNSGFTPRFG